MKIGDIVERLIYVRDRYNENHCSPEDDEALIEACNLLDQLPRMAEAAECNIVLGEKNPD